MNQNEIATEAEQALKEIEGKLEELDKKITPMLGWIYVGNDHQFVKRLRLIRVRTETIKSLTSELLGIWTAWLYKK